MAINYTSELERLKAFVPSDGKGYWSPAVGQYKVKALGELEEAEPFPDDEEKKPRANLQIKVDDRECLWGMSVGKTTASTYGQLIHMATAFFSGKITNAEFTVVVTGEDRNRRFTIVI